MLSRSNIALEILNIVLALFRHLFFYLQIAKNTQINKNVTPGKKYLKVSLKQRANFVERSDKHIRTTGETSF